MWIAAFALAAHREDGLASRGKRAAQLGEGYDDEAKAACAAGELVLESDANVYVLVRDARGGRFLYAHPDDGTVLIATTAVEAIERAAALCR